jgi:hypothetical protein
MRIKLMGAGYDNLTGQFGSHEFVDGVSVEDLGAGDVRLLSAIIPVEEWKDGAATGKNPSVTQQIIDRYQAPADVEPSRAGDAPKPVVPAQVYTAEDLEKIADTSGIKGIREVAAPLELQGKSIAELIGKILNKQAEDAAKAKQAADDQAAAIAKAEKEAAAANATEQ